MPRGAPEFASALWGALCERQQSPSPTTSPSTPGRTALGGDDLEGTLEDFSKLREEFCTHCAIDHAVIA